MKKLSFLLLIGCYLCFNLVAKNVTVSEYPTITWSYHFYDEVTKDTLLGVACIREVYYEYVDCQPSFSPKFIVEKYPEYLADPILPDSKSEILRKQYKQAILDLEKNKVLNDKPIRDTIEFSRSVTVSERNPIKKYALKLTHPDYETVELTENFAECQFEIKTFVGMKRKQD